MKKQNRNLFFFKFSFDFICACGKEEVCEESKHITTDNVSWLLENGE